MIQITEYQQSRIAAFRREHNYSQSDLARAVGRDCGVVDIRWLEESRVGTEAIAKRVLRFIERKELETT